jgi:hypothetical protein
MRLSLGLGGCEEEAVGGQGRDRTADTGFFRPVLFQLSYLADSDGQDSKRARCAGDGT